MQPLVEPGAVLGRNVSIGPFTIVHANVVLADDVTIDSHCVIGQPTPLAGGRPLEIGPQSHIRSTASSMPARRWARAFGPGTACSSARGRSPAGLQIGSQSEIQGDCRIGDFVKTHSSVHIAKQSRIGDFVWFYPRVQFTNDPLPPSDVVRGVTVGDLAVIATGALLLPGVTLGAGAVVTAASVVNADVPEVHVARGNPARVVCRIDQLFDPHSGIAYPWPRHFRTGYPAAAMPRLDALLADVEARLARARGAAPARSVTAAPRGREAARA
ncbi:MAG: N-acetyltransferase [Phycisphaerae bacterium]